MSGLQRLGIFLKSPHHAWTALLALGLGVATASVPGMIVGAAAYALAWVFLPDSRWFRVWAQRRTERSAGSFAGASSARFEEERTKAYMQLSPAGRRTYDALAKVVEEVRAGSGGRNSPHAGRLGQLAWTYLRLLSTKETLSAFCAKENSSEIAREIDEVEAEVANLETQARAAEDRGDAAGAGGAERLLQSKRSRLVGLERHFEHVRKAESDLDLTASEIERLFDAVRLIRADLATRRDPDALGTEIDRTTAHFHRTRDWLRELESELDHASPDLPDELAAGLPLRLPK